MVVKLTCQAKTHYVQVTHNKNQTIVWSVNFEGNTLSWTKTHHVQVTHNKNQTILWSVNFCSLDTQKPMTRRGESRHYLCWWDQPPPRMMMGEEQNTEVGIAKRLLLSILDGDKSAFQSAFQEYSICLTEARTKLGHDIIIMPVGIDEEVNKAPIDTHISYILNINDPSVRWDNLLETGMMMYGDEEDLILVMAVKILILLAGPQNNEDIQMARKHMDFLEWLVHDFNLSMNTLIKASPGDTDEGSENMMSITSYFIEKSGSIRSDNHCIRILSKLLDLGAPLENRNNDNDNDEHTAMRIRVISPLSLAISHGNPICFHVLLQRGASFLGSNTDSRVQGYPLHRAIVSKRPTNILQTLLQRHATLHCDLLAKHPESRNNNILHQAALLLQVFSHAPSLAPVIFFPFHLTNDDSSSSARFSAYDPSQLTYAVQTIECLYNYLSIAEPDVLDELCTDVNADGYTPHGLVNNYIIPNIRAEINTLHVRSATAPTYRAWIVHNRRVQFLNYALRACLACLRMLWPPDD